MTPSEVKKKAKIKLKIVVRGLPPQLNEQAFQSTIEKYLNSIDFWYYVSGRVTEKKSVNSRAYINFKTLETLQEFSKAFDGHIFIGTKGKEQKARIEFAPYQKVPSKTKKRVPESRINTILEDSDYLKFVETLNEPIKLLPSAEEQLDKRLAEEKEREASGTTFITTPLLEYLKAKRAQKLKRGERTEKRKKGKDRSVKDVTGIAVNPDKKSEEKRKERGSRRKDKEERRKKKEVKTDEATEKKSEPQITILKDKQKKEAVIKPEEGEKQRKNGLWQVKKSQEPSVITIQTRESNSFGVETESQHNQRKTQTLNTGNIGQPIAPTNSNTSRRTNNSRRGGRNEIKMYAPKVQQAPVVAAKNGP